MRKVRTVLIGCGDFCRATLPGIRDHEGFGIVGVVDPDLRNRQEVGSLVGLGQEHCFVNAVEAFEAVDADFAFVFSNVGAHAENCRAALLAGCCVSVAKPFVDALSEGQELVALAHARGLWISVGQTTRLSPSAQAMKNLIDRGDLGRAAFGNMHIYRNRMEHLSPYSVHEPWPVINATAIHEFDQLRYLFDAHIVRVSFRGVSADWNPYDDPGVVTGWLEMNTGLVVSYFHSFVSKVHLGADHPYKHAMIQGENGALFWEGPWEHIVVTFNCSEANTAEILPVRDRDFRAQTWDYCQWLHESLFQGRTVFAEASDNLWSLAAIKASQLSAEQGGMPIEVASLGLPQRQEEERRGPSLHGT
ncbi:MAG: Gfo/Idh/MocA family oxidoreductase [Candidatus Latescibacterota bacterium]